MFALLRSSIVLLAIFTAITGVVYPLVVTGAAQLFFPTQANGSLTRVEDRVVGSDLVGQPFDDPRYFWGRPSATSPHPYNAAASTGSNLGPSHPALLEAVRARVAHLRGSDPSQATVPVPVDLVTTSGSGLDPHLSPAAVLYQVHRVASARGLSETRVLSLVHKNVQGRSMGVFGEPRVNVLRLNLALDELARTGS